MEKLHSKYILKFICWCFLIVGISGFLFCPKVWAHDAPGRIDLIEVDGKYQLDQSALDHLFRRMNNLAIKNFSPEKLFQYILSKPAYAQAGGGGGGGCTMSPPPGLTGHANAPAGVTGATGHFGDWRKTRYHKGFDLYHDEPNSSTKEGPTILGPMIGGQQCHPVRPPAGSNINSRGAPRCNAPPNPKGSQYIWNTNPNGYGYYLVFDCSHITGGNFKVRYAHVAGYSEATYAAITGRTAVCNTPAHIHLEMSIDGTFVDPECVYGQPNRSRAGRRGAHKPPCPQIGPPDLCNAQAREALRSDCVHIKMDARNCNSSIPDSGTPTPVGTPTNEIPVTGNTTSTQPSGGEGDGDASPAQSGQSTEYTTPFVGNPATEIDTDGDRITDTPGIDTDGDGYADTPVSSSGNGDGSGGGGSGGSQGNSNKPRCDNSTCITQETMDIAKNQEVDYDKAESHMDYLSNEGQCEKPIETGPDVFHQEPGKYRKYPDAFCANRGCVYENKSEGGDGKCQ